MIDGQSTFDFIAGLAFYLFGLGVAFANIVAATVFAYRRFRERGWSDLSVGWATVGAAVVALAGGWLVFAIYWIGRESVRGLRRIRDR